MRIGNIPHTFHTQLVKNTYVVLCVTRNASCQHLRHRADLKNYVPIDNRTYENASCASQRNTSVIMLVLVIEFMSLLMWCGDRIGSIAAFSSNSQNNHQHLHAVYVRSVHPRSSSSFISNSRNELKSQSNVLSTISCLRAGAMTCACVFCVCYLAAWSGNSTGSNGGDAIHVTSPKFAANIVTSPSECVRSRCVHTFCIV